jgi:hypothetical protein
VFWHICDCCLYFSPASLLQLYLSLCRSTTLPLFTVLKYVMDISDFFSFFCIQFVHSFCHHPTSHNKYDVNINL